MQTSSQPSSLESSQVHSQDNADAPAPLLAEGVTVFRGGVRVLDDVTFSAGPNCLMGVVGPNGAGKSTLFNAIVGLLKVDAGRVLIHGSPVDDARGHIAYVPQHENVNWRVPMSVWDVVMQGRTKKIGWLRRPKQGRPLACRGSAGTGGDD